MIVNVDIRKKKYIWSVNQNSINGQLWPVNTKTSIQQKNLTCMTKNQEMECKNCTSNNLDLAMH